MTAVFRDGVDPLTDDGLGRPYRSFDDGKRHAVVGYDLTFTAPKSVSVLWALAASGSAGVEQLLRGYADDLRHAMQLVGAPTLADLTPDLVDRPVG